MVLHDGSLLAALDPGLRVVTGRALLRARAHVGVKLGRGGRVSYSPHRSAPDDLGYRENGRRQPSPTWVRQRRLVSHVSMGGYWGREEKRGAGQGVACGGRRPVRGGGEGMGERDSQSTAARGSPSHRGAPAPCRRGRSRDSPASTSAGAYSAQFKPGSAAATSTAAASLARRRARCGAVDDDVRYSSLFFVLWQKHGACSVDEPRHAAKMVLRRSRATLGGQTRPPTVVDGT